MMDAGKIKKALFQMPNYHGVYVDEFSYGGKRIDAVIIDTAHRWVRGFEVKVSRADFLNDTKWVEYTAFLSSLSIACPDGLIDKSEVESPFGLLYVSENKFNRFEYRWVKRPKNFQKRNSLAWLWTYVRVIEAEMPRMGFDIAKLRGELNYLNEKHHEALHLR